MKKYVVELSDDELMIITKKELDEWKESAVEYDGFEGWIVKGELIPIANRSCEGCLYEYMPRSSCDNCSRYYTLPDNYTTQEQ